VIEHDDFPLPLDGVMTRKHSKYVKNTDIAQYALHQMLRDPRECSLFSEIRAFDKEIKKCRDTKRDLPMIEKKAYEKLIMTAKLEVIKNKEIILCTCHTSSGKLIEKGTNIKQVIFMFVNFSI
jgi:ribosomal protein L19E